MSTETFIGGQSEIDGVKPGSIGRPIVWKPIYGDCYTGGSMSKPIVFEYDI